MAEPTYSKLTTSHFYGWSLGLKTGQYYLRSRPARDAIKFTVDIGALLKHQDSGVLMDHMSFKNQTSAEMEFDMRKRYSEEMERRNSTSPDVNKEKEDKKDVKECPFNPDGNDDCDMCGS
jgi:hypothetical protein